METLMALVKQFLGVRFDDLTREEAVILGARLLPVLPDLVDGDPRISLEHRAELEDVIADFEKEVLA